MTDAETVFEVDAILDEKTGVGGKKLFLVKWKGFTAKFNTWY